MSQYQTISRKYRPSRFSEVSGQEAIVRTLKNAVKQDRVGHAYLFTGCRGTGKTTLSRLFAKLLNCAKLTDDLEPCNACTSCKEIAAGSSLDVIEIDGASNRGIDDVRNLNETVKYATFAGKYKIYIIDEVHMLTKEAFNALLKTLEEPPANVKFFFATTEAHKILPTILSRCQRFDLTRLSLEQIEEKLSTIAGEKAIEISPEALKLIARLGDGSMRDSESFFEQVTCYQPSPITLEQTQEALGIFSYDIFFRLDTAYKEGDLPFAFELAKEIFTRGKETSHFLESLLEHYRTILLTQISPNDRHLQHLSPDEINGYRAAYQIYTKEMALYLIGYLSNILFSPNKIPFRRLHIETILIHIIQSASRTSLTQIVHDLNQLKEGAPITPNPVSTPPIAEKAPTPAPAPPAAALPKPAPAAELPKPTPDPAAEVVSKPQPAPPTEAIPKPAAPTLPGKRVPTEVAQTEVVPHESIEPMETPPLPSAVQTDMLDKPAQEAPVSETPACAEGEERDPKDFTLDPAIQLENTLRFAAVELNGRLTI